MPPLESQGHLSGPFARCLDPSGCPSPCPAECPLDPVVGRRAFSPPRALTQGDDNDTDFEDLPPDDWALDEPVRSFPQDVSWLDPDDDDEAQPEPGDFWIDPDQIRED